jgi:anaerobic magnesium-protoporphyrin IX monomethyl ester cyclase
VVYREGENALTDIANGTSLSQIKGICYRDGETRIINQPSPLMENLDNLPLPDKSMINFSRCSGLFPVGKRPCMFIMASRGCPYQCTFCSKSVYGNTLRQRSPENVVEEIELLYKDWGVREIHFADDTFNANLNWAHKLLDLIIKGEWNKKLAFRIALRVNEKIVNYELLKHLKAAGVWFIYYGVENGNQAMLDRMHKGIKIEEVKRAFRITHTVGIKTEAFFIIGMPGETKATIKDSYNLYKEINPWWGGFSKAMPFPNTLFAKEVEENGQLLCKDYEKWNPSNIVVRTDELTSQELDNWTDKMNNMTRKSKIFKPKQMMYLAIDQAKSMLSAKQWTKPGGSI